MPDCCSPKGYQWVFSERSARGEARRYRRKGLDGTSRRIVDFLKAQGVEGRTVLEVGGGIGALQLELLKAGASRALSIELTPTYEDVAAGLLREAGLTDRVERRVMDFAEAASQIDGADIVVLNRVICCYPDMPKLAGADSRSCPRTSCLKRTSMRRDHLSPIAHAARCPFVASRSSSATAVRVRLSVRGTPIRAPSGLSRTLTSHPSP